MFEKLLPKILPLLFKLFFANEVTTRIEIIMQIGTLFNLDLVVKSALDSINISGLAAGSLHA